MTQMKNLTFSMGTPVSSTPQVLVKPLLTDESHQLLNFICGRIDDFFERTPGQLILDSLDLNSWESKALKSKVKDTAIIELNHFKLGGFDRSTASHRKSYDKLRRDYAKLQQKLKQKINSFLQNWMTQNPEDLILPERLETIKQIFKIFLDTKQVSELTFLWITKFALASTTSSSKEIEEFYLSVSLGGDAVIPPYIEAYIIQPLSVLRQLKQLQERGLIKVIPRLSLIFTYHCQAVENYSDRAGNAINPTLHIYNSQVTLRRIAAFINTFFTEIAKDCDLVVFPNYQKYSLARLFFAILWNQIPIEPQIRQRLFAIKGKVQDDKPDSQDLIKSFLGPVNPYVSRHVFTDLNLSNANSLRYGSDRTEPQFHLAVTSLCSVLRENGEAIREQVKDLAWQLIQRFLSQPSHKSDLRSTNLIEQDSLMLDGLHLEVLLNQQFSRLPPLSKLHAQIGMENTHACYYKHPDEPSLQEIITSGNYSAQHLREQNRPDKARKMEQTFAKAADCVGKEVYLGFLSQWCPQYLSKNLAEAEVFERLCDQVEIVNSLILTADNTRQLLNYWLS